VQLLVRNFDYFGKAEQSKEVIVHLDSLLSLFHAMEYLMTLLNLTCPFPLYISSVAHADTWF